MSVGSVQSLGILVSTEITVLVQVTPEICDVRDRRLLALPNHQESRHPSFNPMWRLRSAHKTFRSPSIDTHHIHECGWDPELVRRNKFLTPGL